MSLRIGIIGCGAIGQDHARRLHFKLSGASVVALNDINLEATQAFSLASGINAKVYANYEDLIQAPDVDALLVASWGDAHEEQVLACINAGKPVFVRSRWQLRQQVVCASSKPRSSTARTSSRSGLCAVTTQATAH